MRGNGDKGIYLWHFIDAERGADGLCSLLASCDDGLQTRQAREQGTNVGRFNNLEELIGSIVLQPTDSRGGIEESDTLLLAERNNLIYTEALGRQIHEMVPVTKEDLSLNAPVVVDPIRVEKVHTPPLSLRREAAKEQDFRTLREERNKRMILDAILAASDVFFVQN